MVVAKGMRPVGGPLGWKVAKAGTIAPRALLMTELDMLAMNEKMDMRASMVNFRHIGQFSGSAGSGDGSGWRCRCFSLCS